MTKLHPAQLCILALLVAPAAPGFCLAQSASRLPFVVGERISYRVSVARLGTVGTGAMWIEGPVDIRGISTWLLRFDFSAGRGPLKAADRTSSWLDPVRMSIQRFQKHEDHVLSRRDELIEVFPSRQQWASRDGDAGDTPTDAPLDELSFMYFIRTLELDDDTTTYQFNRHFDRDRNPTTVHVIRRESVATPAGKFATVLVEMRVKDPRRYRGEGRILINLTDDSVRLPVRIESTMPLIGRAVMTLQSFNNPAGRKLARLSASVTHGDAGRTSSHYDVVKRIDDFLFPDDVGDRHRDEMR